MAGNRIQRDFPGAEEESKGTLRWLLGAVVLTVAAGLFAEHVWWEPEPSLGARVAEVWTYTWPVAVAAFPLLFGVGWIVTRTVQAIAAIRHRRRWSRVEAEICSARPFPTSEVLEEFWSPTAVPAWRAWRWTGEVLHGVWQPWESPTLVAECPLCLSAPADEHTCGIYAFKEPSEVVAMTGGQTGLVIGRVELTGLVIEHDRGYRAGEARMVELMAAPSIAAAVQARYPDVPVSPRLLEGMIDG